MKNLTYYNCILTLVLIFTYASDISCSRYLAYDCAKTLDNTTVFDLVSPSECRTEMPNISTEIHTIQVLQKVLLTSITVRSCKVRRSRTLYRCAWFSDMQMIPKGYSEELLSVDSATCDYMLASGSYKTSFGTELNGIGRNSESVHTVNEIGIVESGKCEGTTFTLNGITYQKVVSTDVYRITTKIHDVPVDLTSGVIRLSDTTHVPLHSSRALTAELGSSHWVVDSTGICDKNHIKELYTGDSTRLDLESGRTIWMVNTSKRAFALEVKSMKQVCNRRMWSTNDPTIYIYEVKDSFDLIKSQQGNIEGLNESLNLLSKLMFFDIQLSQQLNRLAYYLEVTFCESNYMHLQTLLRVAKTDTSEFALRVMGEPGYTADVKGSVAYILKCQPVLVSPRQTEKCYQDMPVVYKNESWFLNPSTRIVMSASDEFPCSPVAPTLYQIGSSWIRTSPYLDYSSIKPVTLNPNIKQKWSYKISNLGQYDGLYTAEDEVAYRKFIVTKLSETAVLRTLTRSLTGTEVDTKILQLDQILSDENIKRSYVKISGWIWSKFTDLGMITSGFLGVWLLTFTIIKVISIISNMFIIYKKHGPNVRIILGVSDILTRILVASGEHKISLRKCKESEAIEDPNTIKSQQPSDTQEKSGGYFPLRYPTLSATQFNLSNDCV